MNNSIPACNTPTTGCVVGRLCKIENALIRKSEDSASLSAMCRATKNLGLRMVEALHLLRAEFGNNYIFMNRHGERMSTDDFIGLLRQDSKILGKIAREIDCGIAHLKNQLAVNGHIMWTVKGPFTTQQRLEACRRDAAKLSMSQKRILSDALRAIATHAKSIEDFKHLIGLSSDPGRLQRATEKMIRRL